MADVHHDYQSQDHLLTRFTDTGQTVKLDMLLGAPCGRLDAEYGPHRTCGLHVVDTAANRYENNRLVLEHKVFLPDQVQLSWRTKGEAIRIDSTWSFFADSGIWTRRDVLTNTGDKPITVLKCHSRVTFRPGAYELYSQQSRPCGENQGGWQRLTHGGLILQSEGGRSLQGSTPYLALREKGSHIGVALHLLPQGNWSIHVYAHSGGATLPHFLTVELGLADERLHLLVAPGESVAMPELLMQSIPDGQPHLAAAPLHRHVQKHLFASAKKQVPVAYNTWLDTFDRLDVDRLKRQLATAKELGCEVFTVDAGWFGGDAVNWWMQVGDWREKTKAAFGGQMKAFADHVRDTGLGFGLWMEPERIGVDAPILNERPEWFIAGDNGFFWPDLTQQAVYEYVRSEMSRLIDTYQLAWMKVDFNFDRGMDATGSEFFRYYQSWYGLLDEIRSAYPQVFLESCASGGLRLDLAMLSHCDGHFLSDNADPTQVIRINEGAMLRVPPGRITKWVVLRSAGEAPTTMAFDKPTMHHLAAPGVACWRQWSTVNLDYMVMSAMPGIMALSGDIAGLPRDDKKQLARYVAFYKQWRQFIVGGIAHVLTEPGAGAGLEGYSALQMQSANDPRSLVFVYRLANTDAHFRLALRDLDAQRRYTAYQAMADTPAILCSGAELMHQGLSGRLSTTASAGVWVIEPSQPQ
jgi:alpha-galactosidase